MNQTTIQGYTFNHHFSFSQKDVTNFAEATGDKNAIHLDEDYAFKTIFKKPIIHGFLGGSIFSKIFGTVFPGEGTIYIKQDLSFIRPMYINTQYTATFTTLKILPESGRALIKTEITNPENKTTISAEAIIQNKIYLLSDYMIMSISKILNTKQTLIKANKQPTTGDRRPFGSPHRRETVW